MTFQLKVGTKEELKRWHELALFLPARDDEAALMEWARTCDPDAWRVPNFQHRRFLSLAAGARAIAKVNAEAPVPPFVLVIERAPPAPPPSRFAALAQRMTSIFTSSSPAGA